MEMISFTDSATLFFVFPLVGWMKAVDEDRNSHQIRDQLIIIKVTFGGNGMFL